LVEQRFGKRRVTMSGNQRGYTWLDETVEHSGRDEAMAKALATRWSQLHNEAEQRSFLRTADYKEGRYDYDPYEDCECEVCLVNVERDGNGAEIGGPDCLARKADEQAKLDAQAERDLEVEIVEEKLAPLGARMMRPYEHWNEDEHYMEYAERDR
jgi:hypothetical protein